MEIINKIDPPLQLVSQSQLQCLGWKGGESAEQINELLLKYGIDTPERVRAFFTQCCAETGYGFYKTEIASGDAYEGRKDLGNIFPGDGSKFKGAGYIQVTGRGNYQAFADSVNDQQIVEQGVKYAAEHYPFEIACFWWQNANANKYVGMENELKKITMLAYTGSAENTKFSSLDKGAWNRREEAQGLLSNIIF